ncbi:MULTISPECIES: insulinase family protein [unclassified Moraxella]|uniref:insulinase family protein n=1 Tax=unclassified Moraxella TaxID=2685852 RepID=UPI00359D065F
MITTKSDNTPKQYPSPAFEWLGTTKIEALDIDVEHYRHKETGLVHFHLACQNDENALMIGFATQPMTSRGEAHILEHVVLCGSEKYPVRDPFFSMIKRSLQTFMNAMTAADWTVYPFATQNKNDFFNLLSVYADACFFPNIHELDFAQEGIRVEINDDGKPEYHGIVFNEMKGAMSGEIDQLYYALTPHLFPTTTYHYNSGGDPEHIIKLTHEDLLKFHQAHYHPSNAIVMSFGNIEAVQIQEHLQKNVLVRFDDVSRPKIGKKFASVLEQRLDEPVRVFDTYTADDNGGQKTHHVLSWLLPSIKDPKERLAMRLMEGVLVEHSGSPLRAYLESYAHATAPSPLLGLDDSHYEMVFYAGVRGSDVDYADDVEAGILGLLQQVVADGVNLETIETVLHQIELDQRHIGGDSMPYGLTLMLEAFSTVVHDGDPLDVWQIDEHLNWLRQQATDPSFMPSLIQKHLIDNPHRVRLTLSPDKDKAQALIDKEQATIDALDRSLTDEDKADIRQRMMDLQARQAMADDVDLLPKVDLSDVPSDIAFVHANKQPIALDGEMRTLYEYHAGTNGLYYYQVVSELGGYADEILGDPLLPIYLTLLSEVGTTQYDARAFQAVQAAHSSGVTARISQRTDVADKDKMSSYFVVATRALNRKLEAIDLVSQVLDETIFGESNRIRELLQQKQTSWQSRLTGAGHAYAMQTASRNMSQLAKIEYAYSGLPALSVLKAFLAESGDEKWSILSARLAALHARITALPKDVILVCEAEASDVLKGKIVSTLHTKPLDAMPTLAPIIFDELADIAKQGDDEDIAWLISTNVYHNAAAYAATTSDGPDAAALMVLALFLRNGYLHTAIREKGGAYGGGATFDGNAAAFKFFSYRDPNCAATFEHFTNSIDWLLDNEHQNEQLEEAILGIIAGMDKPGSPAGEAVKSCFAILHGRDKDYQQSLRAKILSVGIDDLKRVARIYLKDKPCTKASLAPLEQESQMTELGFSIKKLS